MLSVARNFVRRLNSLSAAAPSERLIFENRSKFNIRVLATVSGAFVTATSVCVAIDLTQTSSARQEKQKFYMPISNTTYFLSLGSFVMLTLLAILPKRYVVRLSVVNRNGLGLKLTTWTKMGSALDTRVVPLKYLRTGSKVYNPNETMFTFRLKNERPLFSMDTEKGKVLDQVLFKSLLRGPEYLLRILDQQVVIVPRKLHGKKLPKMT
mmetsp:Transcript_728/g.2388  ORF Transcript_728/g.2388 Transcript_728/m.2388 type:complete len:209 (-) Transcript_728:55-681(-)